MAPLRNEINPFMTLETRWALMFALYVIGPSVAPYSVPGGSWHSVLSSGQTLLTVDGIAIGLAGVVFYLGYWLFAGVWIPRIRIKTARALSLSTPDLVDPSPNGIRVIFTGLNADRMSTDRLMQFIKRRFGVRLYLRLPSGLKRILWWFDRQYNPRFTVAASDRFVEFQEFERIDNPGEGGDHDPEIILRDGSTLTFQWSVFEAVLESYKVWRLNHPRPRLPFRGRIQQSLRFWIRSARRQLAGGV